MTNVEASAAHGERTLIRPVILCGGMGTRLWPLSRSQFPKQLADFSGSRSLLQNTVNRVSGPIFSKPILVSGEDHRFLIQDQLRDIGVEPECLILEQTGRNTAPAIGIAVEWLMSRYPDEVVLVLPSDHVINDERAFEDAVGVALGAAQSGKLVTFGITPHGPETGYGYIEFARAASDAPIYDVSKFVEKPTLAKAREYIDSGNYFWNAGIFLFRAQDFSTELATHSSDVASWAKAAVESGTSDGVFFRPLEENEASPSPTISVDYAIMERSDRVCVVPADIGWSDLGSWGEVWARADHDENGNATHGKALAVESTHSLVYSYGDLTVAALGVEDLVVVATRDAILVAPRDRGQEVRKVVTKLKELGDETGEMPNVIHRPWGTYQTTDRDVRFQTKRIVVKPGAKLSSQLHHHRSEHWVVVTGTAEVTVGNKTFLLHENESTYISAGTVHRLANPGKVPLHLIEVQCGTYLGEDDIVRFDDAYGRARQAQS
jgi:mannose-1-phosphate guanylyltransferase/mannose-6-phosphate isomerase